MAAVAADEEKVLISRSGGMCAFPACGRLLIVDGGNANDSVFTGRICHIVARSRQGPRGSTDIDPEGRDRYPNLILLC